MPKTGDIYIYGTIRNEQSEEQNSFWGEVSLTNVKNQISKLASDVTDIVVHIHSNGGDVFEGFAIHDFLRGTGKNIITKIEGMCASIATIIALAGDTRVMSDNSTFLIHNPAATLAYGDADELENQAAFLREVEDKIISFYSEKTGQTKEIIDGWMKEEKTMTSQEALDLGFVTEIANEIKIAAVFSVHKNKQPKNEIEMSETKSVLDKANELLNKIKGLVKTDAEANLILNTKDGGKIEIVTTGKIPNVQDKVLIDNKPAPDGEYELMDSTKIVVTSGEVASVTDPEGNKDNDAPNEEVIAELKKENSELKAKIASIEQAQAAINESMALIAENIESVYDPKARKNAFNTPKEVVNNESPAAKALRERKEAAQAEKK